MLNVHPIASMLNGPLVLATSVTWAHRTILSNQVGRKEQSASHPELILESELDLKILKTHLGVILFLINLIISIYCLLSPETETFMLFLGAQGLKLLQIFIVTVSQIQDFLFEFYKVCTISTDFHWGMRHLKYVLHKTWYVTRTPFWGLYLLLAVTKLEW